MSFLERSSPARVTEAAAAKLPRWMLVGLLAAYILPGLFGRDPWSLDDMSAFGVMWAMAHGTAADWWIPSIAGEPLPEEGPLPFWLGAALIRLLGPSIGDIQAARLVTPIWLIVGTAALWYATYRLARRDEAQPVAFAFGGEASPRAYGRMLADVSVLLLLATFGVLVRMHETSAETALLALTSLVLFGLALSLDDPWSGTVVTGVAVGAIALSRGWLPAAVLLAASVIFVFSYGRHRALRAIVLALLAAGVFLIWPLGARSDAPAAASHFFDAWWVWNAASIHWPASENIVWLLRNLGWYTWPLWPFALWTLYSWRHGLRRPHVLLPLLLTVAGLVALLISSVPSDRELLVATPPLVVLAVFGVSSLKRTAEDAIDWFALALFSLALMAIWLYFYAWMTGFPPKMHASIARLAPGLRIDASLLSISIAAMASAAWIALVVWRVRVRPPMLWRGPLLAASGLALTWTVAILLFLPPIDYNRSYEPIAGSLSDQLRRVAGEGCVQAYRLPPGTRAMLAYHGRVRFERPEDAGLCKVLLQRDSQRSSQDDAPPFGNWQLVYELTRRARYDEVFRIWVRKPS